MNTQTVKLIDRSRTIVATALVADEGAHFGGTIELASTPSALRAYFNEFEEIVNDQMLSFLDEIQAKIGSFGIKAIFEDGFEADVKDLQVFPSTGEVSFKLIGAPSLATKSA
jgi:hypothetical protein